MPIPFSTPFGLVGLLVFGPGALTVSARSRRRFDRSRLAIADVGALTVAGLMLSAFANGTATGESPIGTALYAGVVVCGGLFALGALARLLRPMPMRSSR